MNIQLALALSVFDVVREKNRALILHLRFCLTTSAEGITPISVAAAAPTV